LGRRSVGDGEPRGSVREGVSAALASCLHPRGAQDQPWGWPPGSGQRPSGFHLSRNKRIHATEPESCKVRNPSWVKGLLTTGFSLEDPGKDTRITGQSRF